jgi:hypothetical protein
MTRIATSEQALVLLREQLQRLGRGRGAKVGRTGAAREATASPIARLQAQGGLEALSGDEFRRTLVRALLTEELGDAMANDPSFQAVADDVFRIISDTPDGQALIDRAARQLRGTA